LQKPAEFRVSFDLSVAKNSSCLSACLSAFAVKKSAGQMAVGGVRIQGKFTNAPGEPGG